MPAIDALSGGLLAIVIAVSPWGAAVLCWVADALWALATMLLVGLVLNLITYRWLLRPIDQITGLLAKSRWYQPPGRDAVGLQGHDRSSAQFGGSADPAITKSEHVMKRGFSRPTTKPTAPTITTSTTIDHWTFRLAVSVNSGMNMSTRSRRVTGTETTTMKSIHTTKPGRSSAADVDPSNQAAVSSHRIGAASARRTNQIHGAEYTGFTIVTTNRIVDATTMLKTSS